MAIVKLGDVVVNLSGRLGSLVFAPGKGKTVVRLHPKLHSGYSRLQAERRAFKAYLAKRWAHHLNDLQRQGWRMLKYKDRSGDSIYIGGNIVRNMAGLDVQDTAPENLAVRGIVELIFVPTASGASLIYFSPSPLDSGHRLYIFARGPLHHSRIARLFNLRFLGVSPTGVSSPWDVGPLLESKYGPLQAGEWISLLVAIMRDDGGVRTTGIMVNPPDGQIGP